MLIVDKNSFFKVGNMKKSLLIVLSLILASLLLVVACDDKVDPENPSIELPEGAPSLDPEDLDEITGDPVEPDKSDLVLLQTVIEEIQGYLMTTDSYGDPELSDEATVILSDLVKAVGEKGIELEGEGYALSFTADFENLKFTASGSFDSFVFERYTFDGSVNATITANEDYDPEVYNSKRYLVVEDKTDLKVTIGEGEPISCKSVDAVVDAIDRAFDEDGPKEEDQKALTEAAAAAIPGLVEAVNDFIKEYTIKTDLLTVVLSGDINTDELDLTWEKVGLGKGLEASLKATAYTNEPLEINGSQYKVFAYGNVKAVVKENPYYDPENYKDDPFIITVEGTLNVVLETSGKIGEQKVRLQAKVNGNNLGAPKVEALVVVNDKVIDLKALMTEED